MSNIRHIPIVGAGLAGLLAAHAWPNSPVFEAAPGPSKAHAAVLRFRSDAASHLTGIPFKQVKVRKGIWFEGRYVQPDIQLANFYSGKVLGKVRGDRSIWNIGAELRWIAPSDFYERMIEQVGSRIEWFTTFNFTGGGRVVSTAPLGVVLNSVGIPAPAVVGAAQSITAVRMRVEGVDAYQTTYFPDPNTVLYRATLEGDTLICELVGEHALGQAAVGDAVDCAMNAMGIMFSSTSEVTATVQRLGKIESLPDDERKALLFKLSSEHGIYSLGRFATWRNVLLDDVVQDINVIKRLLATDRYGLRQHAAR